MGTAVPKAADAAALGQVDFEEVAMPAAESAEGVQCLDHAGALGPAAAVPAGQRQHGHSPAARAALAAGGGSRHRARLVRRAIDHVARRRRLRSRCWPAAGSGPGRSGRAQVGADPLVLFGVEAVFFEQAFEVRRRVARALRLREQAVEQADPSSRPGGDACDRRPRTGRSRSRTVGLSCGRPAAAIRGAQMA